MQLAEQIRLLVRRGALSVGDPLPTVRELAVALGINANTVTRVYRDRMNRNGSMTSRNTTPDTRTTMLKKRPISLVNVMSPNPGVVITTRVQ